jgi:RND family efflux transporter MFP subunit
MSKKKITLIVVIAAFVVFAAIRLNNSHARNTAVVQTNISSEEVAVSTAGVIKQDASYSLSLTGTLSAIKELNVASEVQGRIASVNFKEGQHVGAGSVLAVLDDKTKKLAYESARISADRLKKDYARIENLHKAGSASDQEYDNARTSYETAQKNLDQMEKQYSDTKIRSAIGGIIAEKKIEVGAYVNAGTVIASVVDISRLKVKINVSESNIYALKLGSKVKVTSDVYPGTEFQGTITFISPRGDDAHNYPVEVEMPNSSAKPLKAGSFVNVRIEVAAGKTGLYIPREALQGSTKEAKVYVVREGKARLIDIAVGEERGDLLEVTSGLSESDVLIVSGQVNLVDNKAVKIINSK